MAAEPLTASAGRAGAGEGALLLAVETATPALGVALLRGESLRAEVSGRDARVHAEELLPAVERALALARVALADVEAFAVSIGPGSFTGLRVGLATVKAFALGSGRPAVPVPTLAALAGAAAGAPGPVAALLDARRGEAYAAAWGSLAGAEAMAPPELLAEGVYGPDALAAALPEGTVAVAGEPGAAAVAREALAAGARLRLVEGGPALPRAERVGRLGARALARGEGREAATLVPRYVRRAEAEARRTGRPLEPEAEDPQRRGAL